MDLDKWIHSNCALWSYEVFEMQNGSLMNVFQAVERSLTLSCVHCHKSGASLKCFRSIKSKCTNVYHFQCAIKEKCAFFKDKSVFCSQHLPKIVNQDEQMTNFALSRKVYVNREEHQQIANMIQNCDQSIIRYVFYSLYL